MKADIWEEKDIDDFLRYMSHEYHTWCVYLSFFLFDYIYWATGETGSDGAVN
jgi:hypothetical protein